MNDKALIKSYQIWQFSRSTISQVENIYDSIINPQQNASGDKIAQLMFMEKLFGMCNISYMLEKDYTADQCRENLDTMHELKKLGYSRLHRLIIKSTQVKYMNAYMIIFCLFVKNVSEFVFLIALKVFLIMKVA